MTNVFEVGYYWPDGCGGPEADKPAPHGKVFETLEKARAAIHASCGNHGGFSLNGEEHWNESEEDGCGGFFIHLRERGVVYPDPAYESGYADGYAAAKEEIGG